MRKTILTILFILPLLVTAALADNLTLNSNFDNFGFSSEESGGSSYLGVDTRDITPDRLSTLHLKEERGVEVTMVDQDAPAGKAGLKEQDVILTLNGEKVESVEQLRRMIRETPSGRIVSLGISRSGQPMTIKVQLSDRKNSYNYDYHYNYTPQAKDFHFEMPAMPAMPPAAVIPDIDIPVSIVVVHSSARSGLMVENLTPQLGDFFGTKNGQGVLVRSVEKGSRADKAGFHAGDVIVKINDESIHDSGDFSHALRSRKDNKAIIGILRDKKEQTITLTLPERKESDLYWESFDVPEFDAERDEELSTLKNEVAHLHPGMAEASREMREMGREMQRQTAEARQKQSEAWRKQAEEWRKSGEEWSKHAEDWQKQGREQAEEWRSQMRDLQRQYRDEQSDAMNKLREEMQHLENEF